MNERVPQIYSPTEPALRADLLNQSVKLSSKISLNTLARAVTGDVGQFSSC